MLLFKIITWWIVDEVAGPVFLAGHLGELTQVITPALVDDVLGVTRRVQCRVRKPPSRVVVYFVLVLSLFSSDGYRGVWAALTASLVGGQRMSPSEAALRHALLPVDGADGRSVLTGAHQTSSS